MATVKFYLKNPKDESGKLRTDEVSIFGILTIDRLNRIPFTTGERVQPKYWDKKAKEVKANFRGAMEINSHLSDLKENALQLWRDNKSIHREQMKALLDRMVNGAPVEIQTEEYGQKKTSLFTVGRFLAQCKRELDPATVRRYRVVWRALSRFSKVSRLDFSKMDLSFYERFKNFLYDTPNPNYLGYHLNYDSTDRVYVVTPGVVVGQHIGLFDDVVFKYIVILKTICEWVENRGYKVHPSYKDPRQWVIIKREYPPISLTRPELEAIENLHNLGYQTITKLRESGRKSKYRINLSHVWDYFVFACRTGQRISDIMRFQAIQVKGDTWTFVQKKGNRTKIKTIELPLVGFSSVAELILKRNNYKLPKISEGDLNIGIKELARIAGITEPIYIERWAGNKQIRIPGTKDEFISTHTGKKSFITILASEGVPVKAISDFTGTSIRTIESHYLGKTDPAKARQYLMQAGGQQAIMKAG